MKNKSKEKPPEEKGKDSAAKWAAIGVMITAIFGSVSAIIASYLGYLQVLYPSQLQATQTAEANQGFMPPGIGPSVMSQTNGLIFKNSVKYYDFEDKPQDFVTLGVCDATDSSWWENCHDAPSKIIWMEGGVNSEYSLGINVELVPEREQVYTVRFAIDPPIISEAMSADVYIPNPDQVKGINFAAWHAGGNDWTISTLPADYEGWMFMYLDLQRSPSESGISQVHIDLYLPKVAQSSEEMILKIDNLEFYYPASTMLQYGR